MGEEIADPKGLPGVSSPETVESALGIPPRRMWELTNRIEDICAAGGTKADGIRAIAKLDISDEERVYMGFLLCKKYCANLRFPLNRIVLAKIG